MNYEERWERTAIYFSIGTASGVLLGSGLLFLLGPAGLMGGAISGASIGLVLSAALNRNGS